MQRNEKKINKHLKILRGGLKNFFHWCDIGKRLVLVECNLLRKTSYNFISQIVFNNISLLQYKLQEGIYKIKNIF